MINIIVCGAAGRVGKRIIACASEDKDIKVAGALESANNPDIGKDAGEISGIGKIGVKVVSDLKPAIKSADVVIDFSFHEVTPKIAEIAAENKRPLVIGTTGLTKTELETIGSAAKSIPVLMAPNMSVGANLLFSKAGEIAKMLGSDYDIEIIEAHHRFKKDAPSGTAKRIAEAVANATGRMLEKCGIYGRKGDNSLRREGEIGIHAVRAGDIVGDHTIIYSAIGERIELTHRAHSRDTFAKGALRAAKFIKAAKPGMYDMQDVLKITIDKTQITNK